MVTKLETILKEKLGSQVNVFIPSFTPGIIIANPEIYKLNQMKVDKGEPDNLNQVGVCRTITTLQLTKDFKTRHEDYKKDFYHILKENPKLDIYEYVRKRILLKILESIIDVFGVTRKVYSDNPTSDSESNLIIYVTPDSNVGIMMLKLFTYTDKVEIELIELTYR